MPTIKRIPSRKKQTHVKVYRPEGTKYAEGEARYLRDDRGTLSGWSMIQAMLEATGIAFRNFHEEFRRVPNRDQCVVEVVTDSTKASATIFELPPEPREAQ